MNAQESQDVLTCTHTLGMHVLRILNPPFIVSSLFGICILFFSAKEERATIVMAYVRQTSIIKYTILVLGP